MDTITLNTHSKSYYDIRALVDFLRATTCVNKRQTLGLLALLFANVTRSQVLFALSCFVATMNKLGKKLSGALKKAMGSSCNTLQFDFLQIELNSFNYEFLCTFKPRENNNLY